MSAWAALTVLPGAAAAAGAPLLRVDDTVGTLLDHPAFNGVAPGYYYHLQPRNPNGAT